jgi:predicted nucleic acid-binding protein
VNGERPVLDASPLIAFHHVDQLDLLPELFRDILIPPVVAQEVAPSLGTLPGWIQVQDEFPSVRRLMSGAVRGWSSSKTSKIQRITTL